MAGRLQDVILRGLAADKPLATTVAPGTLYHSNDTLITERCADDGLTWESYSDGGSGSVSPHATTHEPGGTDVMAVDAVAATGSLRTLGTGATQAAAGNDARFSDSRTPLAHAPSHSFLGSDPVSVLNLGGYPGGSTTFLRADATFSAPPAAPVRIASIGLVIDGGGSAITTGLKGYLEVPFACTILAATLLADVVGSVVIDIWKDTYAAYPPLVADTITAAAKPTIAAANKGQNTTLVGWITAIAAGDILAFNVDSVATITKLTVSLKVQVI